MPPPLHPNPSFWLELAFQGLVAATLTAVAMGVRYALGPRPAKRVMWTLVGVLFLDGALALTGLLQFGPLPPPLFGVVAVGVGLALGFSLSAQGATVARELDYAWLIGFQVFRVPLELMMHRAYSEGVMPREMSYSGYNFDILTGATALVLALVHARQGAPRWLLWAWNLLGCALLANIVFIAITCTPTPLKLFDAWPPNVWVTYWPFVWLPGFFVPLALFGHVLVFRKLRLDH